MWVKKHKNVEKIGFHIHKDDLLNVIDAYLQYML